MGKETAMAMLTGTPPPQVTEAVAPPVTPPVPAQPQELKSTPFQKLAEKESEIVRAREALKKEQEQWGPQKTKMQQFEELRKTDPVQAFKLLGFSEAEMVNFLAAQAPEELTAEEKAIQAAEKAADARIQAFQEQQLKEKQEAQQKHDKTLIQGFKGEITQKLESNKEKFEYCNFYGPEAEALAYEVTLAVVKESQGADIISADEALELVEQYFEERDKEMDSLNKRKLKERLGAEVPVEAPQSAAPTRTRTLVPPSTGQEPQKAPIVKTRTLHSGATSTIAATRVNRNETKEQKRDRLIEALRNGTRL